MTWKARMLATAVVFAAVFAQASGVRAEGLALAAFVAAAWLAVSRTTWLPFLGPTVLPPSVLTPHAPADATRRLALVAPADAVKVVYWAASYAAKDPRTAYGGYANAGVADVNAGGTAVLTFAPPQQYSVRGKRLARHVHYRWVSSAGMASAVKTAFLD